jgi:dephospho-CoA kinase
MKKKNSWPVIILIGGTGSGKSTVARLYKNMGARIIHVDHYARRYLKVGTPTWHRILLTFFGTRVVSSPKTGKPYRAGNFMDARGHILKKTPSGLTPHGEIYRRVLSTLVFRSPATLRQLNRIVHPRLRADLEAEISRHRLGASRPLVLDMAVYPEKIFQGMGDQVIWVKAAKEERLRRLKKRSRMAADQAEARIARQWSDAVLRKVADVVLENDSTRSVLRQRAERLWKKLGPRNV